jgi:hypothetical protein
MMPASITGNGLSKRSMARIVVGAMALQSVKVGGDAAA